LNFANVATAAAKPPHPEETAPILPAALD
jgi:hypothetical protein